MSTSLPSLGDISQAIANAEGYGIPGAIPTVANNPGDLANGDIGYGSMGNGITVYPDPQSGYTALQNQIMAIQNGSSANYSPTDSIASIGDTWTGGTATAPGDPNWANNVASSLGLDPSQSLFGAAGNGSAGGTVAPTAPTPSTTEGGSPLAGAGNIFSALLGGTGAGSGLLERGVVIGIGLILIAGGVFGFDRVQEVAVGAAKTAAI